VSGNGGDLLTIEQLAARSGMTVRNIRAHTARGLLPPPVLRARTGFYGPEHLARLQLITALQRQRFNLAAIKSLLASPVVPSADEAIAFHRTAIGAWLSEAPEVVRLADFAAGFGVEPDPELLARLHKLGVVERLDDDRVRLLNPALMRVGRQLAELGYDVAHLVEVLTVLLRHSSAVAEAFVQMFLDVVWSARVDSGLLTQDLPELSAHVEQLRPLATHAVVAAFQQAMSDASSRALERAGRADREERSRRRGAHGTR
jgi:DNA-binding transcriptional MerR regulator